MIRMLPLPFVAVALAACQSEPRQTGEAFDAIGENETIRLAGTEPFWGGEISGGQARYTSPDNLEGSVFPVERFAGFNGLGFSGVMQGTSFDLTITEAECSDGMSDRVYPYTATLLLGGEQRRGCAWTDDRLFTGPQSP